MNRRRWWTIGAAVVLAMVAGVTVFVAVSDDDEAADSGPANGQSDDEPSSVEAYCAVARERVAVTELLDPLSIDLGDPDELRSRIEAARAALAEAVDAAPESLSDDYDVVFESFNEVFTLFEESDFDFELLAESFDADELAARIDAERVQQAEQAIEAFEARSCVDAPPPSIADATEVAELIRDTFSDDELEIAFRFVGVETIEELTAAILDGSVTLSDLDTAMRSALDQPYDFGDSPELDVLWTTCESGDIIACDALYEVAPNNSRYARFAATCGERSTEPTAGECAADAP